MIRAALGFILLFLAFTLVGPFVDLATAWLQHQEHALRSDGGAP